MYGMGDQHLDVVVQQIGRPSTKWRLTLSKPRVAYRETIRKKVGSWMRNTRNSPAVTANMVMLRCEFEPSGDLETPYVFDRTRCRRCCTEELLPGS